MLPHLKRISIKYNIEHFCKQQLLISLYMEENQEFKTFAKYLENEDKEITKISPFFLFVKNYLFQKLFEKINKLLKENGNVFSTENEFIIEFYTDDGYEFLNSSEYSIIQKEIREYISWFFNFYRGLSCNVGGFWDYAFEDEKKYLDYFNYESEKTTFKI